MQFLYPGDAQEVGLVSRGCVSTKRVDREDACVRGGEGARGGVRGCERVCVS